MAVPPLELKYVKNKVSLLNAAIQVAENEADRCTEVVSHIKSIESDQQFVLGQDILEFPSGLSWFNSAPLLFDGDLKGKVVVLDFFTYCCINCMHILPDLAELERLYSVEDGLVIVGVHSAKFLNEKIPENIENALRRYDIHHPVVNDSDVVLWNGLGVVCWPTLVIIGPDRRLLHYIIGEGHGQELKLFVGAALKYYGDAGRLSTSSITTSLSGSGDAESTKVKLEGVATLSYPGKVCCGGDELYVSDSGCHRVLVVERETGEARGVYGSGEPGLRDGEASQAQFHSPQGLVRIGDSLYVADTENHVVRKVDMASGCVSTVAGTGVQGSDKEGGKKGLQQEISSPWDLASDSDSTEARALFIAMAGTHQIWVYFLKDSKWIKKSEYESGVTLRFSGSGEEANKNNSYPHKACFAQPSGITLSSSDGCLYVADSESSSVRCVTVKDGSVKAVVGGAIDPLDLFAYGDVDGKGREARLQHPLGVAWCEKDRLLYVADSYNHKIKVIDVATKKCTTLAGWSGQSGLVDGSFEHAQFSEPGGLCLDPTGKTLFVADTNNHVIRVLDLDQKTVRQLNIHFPDTPGTFKRLTGKRARTVQCKSVAVPPDGGEVSLTICISLPSSCDWTSGATSAWQVIPDSGVRVSDGPGRGVVEPKNDIVLSLTTEPGTVAASSSIQVELLLYFCEPSGVCHVQGALLTIPLSPTQSAPYPAKATVHYRPELPQTS